MKFPFGMAYLQGLLLLVSGRLDFYECFFPPKQHRNQSIPQWIFVRNRQAALQGLRTHDAFPRLAWHHQRSSDGFRWARRTFETLGPRAGGGHIGLGVEAVEAVETSRNPKGSHWVVLKGGDDPKHQKKGFRGTFCCLRFVFVTCFFKNHLKHIKWFHGCNI